VVFFSVKNIDLISVRQKYNYKEHDRKTPIETDANFRWMRSSLLASVEFQTTETYSNLDLTKVKYSTYKHSREENLKVVE
jgi:hypothetical protein